MLNIKGAPLFLYIYIKKFKSSFNSAPNSLTCINQGHGMIQFTGKLWCMMYFMSHPLGPRENVNILSMPGANQDLLFVHWEIYQAKKQLFRPFSQLNLTSTLPEFWTVYHARCCSRHECDRKANTSPIPTNVPLTNCQIYLDISLQQKLKSFKTSSTVCSLDKCPLLNLMLKLPLLISSLCLKRRFFKKIKTCQPKLCHLDPVPTLLLLEWTDSLLPYLTYFINISLQSATFPSEFKTSLVKHLLKKREKKERKKHKLDPSQLKNYCPVLNLSFLCWKKLSFSN